MSSRNCSSKTAGPSLLPPRPVPCMRPLLTTNKDKAQARMRFADAYQVSAAQVAELSGSDDKTRKPLLTKLSAALGSLGDTVKAMTIFPGGAWDLEDFLDVLTWLSTLQKLPKSLAATHAIVGITRLSGEITAPSLTAFPSEDEDEDNNEEENDALDEEEMPVLMKAEKIAKDKGKGHETANPGNEEKTTPCDRRVLAKQ